MGGTGFVRATIVVIILLLLSEIICTRARHITRQHSYDDHHHSTMRRKISEFGKAKVDEVMSRKMRKGWKKLKRAATLQVAGSTLPDCSHACGSCTPCRLVVISFVCATIQEAETCPVSYKYDDHHHSTMRRKISEFGKAKVDEVMSRKMRKGWKKLKRAATLQVAGSTLPDCSHACGSCTPCRLVVISFVCATIQEAETCPVSYKCMCNKSYHVP